MAKKQTKISLGFMRDFFDGSFLTKEAVTKQIPFILFLSVLAFLYIRNQYHAEKLYRETIKLQKEVKDLRSESISTAAELMYISNQTEIQKLVKLRVKGLKELTEPPIKITIGKEN